MDDLNKEYFVRNLLTEVKPVDAFSLEEGLLIFRLYQKIEQWTFHTRPKTFLPGTQYEEYEYDLFRISSITCYYSVFAACWLIC